MIFYNKITIFKNKFTNLQFDESGFWLSGRNNRQNFSYRVGMHLLHTINSKETFAYSEIVSRGKFVDKYRNKMHEYKNLSGSDTICTSFAATAESSDDDSTLAYLQPCWT